MKATMQDVDLSIVDILEHGATSFGGSMVYTLDADGIRRITFAAVADRAARLGSALAGLGIGVGDRVGTFAWNTAEHLEAYFAVPSLGAVLHTVNPRFTAEQAAWCLSDAGTSILIVDSTLLEALADVLVSAPSVRTVITYRNGDNDDRAQPQIRRIEESGVRVYDYEDLVAAGSPEGPWVRVPETSAAALCYTSGTTGRPKGVVYSHRSIWLHSLLNTSGIQFGLSRLDTVLPAVPMFHVMGWNLPFSSFMVGCNLILTNRSNQAEPLLQAITELRPTFGAGVPTIWSDIAHRMDADHEGRFDVSSLQRISSGGAVVSERLLQWWQLGRQVAVIHGCGMTETSSTMTTGMPPDGYSFDEMADSQHTQGQFVIGVRGRVVDEQGRLLPSDGKSAGELQLRGPWVANGYLNGEGAAQTDDGWLPTGDIAVISPDGYITYTDRLKDIIKSGGEWISSVALEAHLAGHPQIREVAVVAVDDEKWQERPAAVIVARDELPSVQSLRDHVAGTFPKFWIPDRWEFVTEIPRTSVGKHDKKLLRGVLHSSNMPAGGRVATRKDTKE